MVGLYLNKGRYEWEGKWGTAGYALPVINIQRASSVNSLGQWHALLRSVADCKHWPRLVYHQQCMVTLLMFHRLAREHASHLVYNESSSVKSCLSLRTCSVLFQLMSTAGPLARCSEFNERNDLGGFFSSIFAQQKIGQRALKGNKWLIVASQTLQTRNAIFIVILSCMWHCGHVYVNKSHFI